jgi:hypothetical protein
MRIMEVGSAHSLVDEHQPSEIKHVQGFTYSFAGGPSATAASVVSSRNVNVSWR